MATPNAPIEKHPTRVKGPIIAILLLYGSPNSPIEIAAHRLFPIIAHKNVLVTHPCFLILAQ